MSQIEYTKNADGTWSSTESFGDGTYTVYEGGNVSFYGRGGTLLGRRYFDQNGNFKHYESYVEGRLEREYPMPVFKPNVQKTTNGASTKTLASFMQNLRKVFKFLPK